MTQKPRKGVFGRLKLLHVCLCNELLIKTFIIIIIIIIILIIIIIKIKNISRGSMPSDLPRIGNRSVCIPKIRA